MRLISSPALIEVSGMRVAYLPLIVTKLAAIYQVTEEEIAQRTTENSKVIFWYLK
jgi:Tat protein secretion system quality control protein TatD with DNase activity